MEWSCEGAVVARSVLDPVRGVKDRRSEHQEGGRDHYQAEDDPFDVGVAVRSPCWLIRIAGHFWPPLSNSSAAVSMLSPEPTFGPPMSHIPDTPFRLGARRT